MTFWDFLYQASVWQWIGMLSMGMLIVFLAEALAKFRFFELTTFDHSDHSATWHKEQDKTP